jgi:DNA-binding SARP family transcriptional activator
MARGKMVSRSALFVLGPPVLKTDGVAVEIERRKALALLVYLAVSGNTHSRDALATLFRPDHGQSQARANLRRALSALGQALGDGVLDAERETTGSRQGRASGSI